MERTISLKDIAPLAVYRRSREEYVKRMIDYKRARRVKLSPYISILFENRDTVLFQIRELAHSEDLTDPAELAVYIEIYSGMLPGEHELSATLFIEMDEQQKLQDLLVALKGIEHHLSLHVGDSVVPAVFEEVHDDREFTTSVHYLKFPLNQAALDAFGAVSRGDEVPVSLSLDHPNLQASVSLARDTIDSLVNDL